MARFLFLTNAHTNEAFSIACAREAKKGLLAQGHEVDVKKIEFEKTLLGKVAKKKKSGKGK